MRIIQPSGSIKLTNVSLVRMKKGKIRFEVACYQNKVQDWRKGIEKDLDEVLQIPQVFINVSKGQTASNEELEKAFGTTDQNEVIQLILKKGELQVGEKERQAQSSQTRAEILQLIAGKCVNPGTKRPYPVSIIDKTLTELGFNVSTSKPAKTQALDAIKLIQEKNVIPIARARIRVTITDESKSAKKYVDKVKALASEIEDEDWSSQWELTMAVDPGNFRPLDDLVREESKGRGEVQVLDTAVIEQGDQAL